MSKKKNRNMTRRYYDACALDQYYEIINLEKDHSTEAWTSHLGIGEAIFNIIDKTDKDADKKIPAFVEYIVDLVRVKRLKVIGHDNIGDWLSKISECLSILQLSDAVHLATALKNDCVAFRTTDTDFTARERKTKIHKFASDNGKPRFRIVES